MQEVILKIECEACLIDRSLFIMQDFILTDRKKNGNLFNLFDIHAARHHIRQ